MMARITPESIMVAMAVFLSNGLSSAISLYRNMKRKKPDAMCSAERDKVREKLHILFCERHWAEHARACSFSIAFLVCLLIAKLLYCKI